MITNLDQTTKDRINKAIGNIRLIATRVKRTAILDCVERAEIVVNLLNEFRQHVNAIVSQDTETIKTMSFRYDLETVQRVVQATFQADTIYSMLARAKQKSYQDEYRQVWNLLENIHTYVLRVIEERKHHG